MTPLDELFDAVLAHLRAVAAALDPPVPADQVVEWDGDDPALLDAADLRFPVIQVAYSGGDMEPRGQIRGVSYNASEVFSVFVTTANDDLQGPAMRQARKILHGLEQSAQGPIAGTDRVLRRVGEKSLLSVYSGRATYGMRFEVVQSFHKTW